MSEQDALEAGMKEHRAGRLEEAERHYRAVLAARPDHPDALNLLATVERQRGNLAAAAELSRHAIDVRPGVPDYHFNYGEACRASGRLDEAASAYAEALRLDGRDVQVYRALADVYARQQQLPRAVSVLRDAIAANPRYPVIYEDLAGFLARLGRFEDAISACQKSIANEPRRPNAYYKLGAVLTKKRDLTAAIQAYQHAIHLRPSWGQPHAGLAQVFTMLRRFAEAEAASRQALAQDPNLAEAHNHLGTSLLWQGRLVDSISAFSRCIELRPDYIEARANLGWAQLQSMQHEDALATYRAAMEAKPDDSEILSNLLFAQNCVEVDDAALFEAHRAWGEARANVAVGIAGASTRGVFSSMRIGEHRRLRVGYVSPDLNDHPVSRFLEPILTAHDQSQFECVVYSNVLRPDAVSARLRALTHEWNETAATDDGQLAARIHHDQIDILVDLAGHTAGNRLAVFARKPAPIQATYLGYPNTTGLPASIMNYRLTDEICDPRGQADALHTEMLVRLPPPFLCYQPPADAPRVSEAPSRKNGFATFGCFNGMMKITLQMIELWSEILGRVPRSRLLLKNRSLADERLRSRVHGEFSRRGIAEERIIASGPEPSAAEHLMRYHEVDVALDTFPYHGTTTTCEALWMGVPVVTLVGEVHRSRVGLTLLKSVGLEHLATNAPAEYVHLATQLACKPELPATRAVLRDQMRQSALCNRARLVGSLEAAYRRMIGARPT